MRFSSTVSRSWTDSSISIPARALRLACRCAACVHEFTGQPLLKPERVPASVHPKSIVSRGQYAVSVHWSDGHASSMYSWKQMLELGKIAESGNA